MYEYAKIAVPGGINGFLGRNVVELLRERGYKKVVPYSSKEYDFRNEGDTKRFYQNGNFDVVINCASKVAGIEGNMRAPGDFFWDNMLICGNLIRYAVTYSVPKFIQVGTTCSYEANCPIPTPETELFQGLPDASNRCYGVSRLAILFMMEGFLQQGAKCVFNYLIPSNMLGRYDHFNPWYSHVGAALINRMHHAKKNNDPKVTVWGTGKATRDLVNPRDVAEGILLALENLDVLIPINLGSGIETSITGLANIVKSIVEYEGELEFDPTKAEGQMRRCLDITRAKEFLNWTPKISLIDSVQQAYDWFLEEKKWV
jgi:GDP-L-fucose synthase